MVILLILPVYAENTNKQLAANPVQPNQTVQICGAIMIVIVTAGGVVLVMWLNSCLPSAPATPAPTPAQPPPTPAPPPPPFFPPMPPFFPPLLKQQAIMQPAAENSGQTNSSQALIATNNSTVYYWSAIDNGWTDWQTNIYIWSFSTTFTNFVPRAGILDTQGNPMTTAHLESTTDLVQWSQEIYSATGWVSYTSIPNWVSQPVSDWGTYFGYSASKLANIVYVVYDSQGIPIVTNGSCGYTVTNSDGYATTMTSASGVIIPASPSVPHKFYRLASP